MLPVFRDCWSWKNFSQPCLTAVPFWAVPVISHEAVTSGGSRKKYPVLQGLSQLVASAQKAIWRNDHPPLAHHPFPDRWYSPWLLLLSACHRSCVAFLRPNAQLAGVPGSRSLEVLAGFLRSCVPACSVPRTGGRDKVGLREQVNCIFSWMGVQLVQWYVHHGSCLFAVCLCMCWLNFPTPGLDLVGKKQQAVAAACGVVGLASRLKLISFLQVLFLALTSRFVVLRIPSQKTCSPVLVTGAAEFGGGQAAPCAKLCKAVYWSRDCRNERAACVLTGLGCGMCGCIRLHMHMSSVYL